MVHAWCSLGGAPLGEGLPCSWQFLCRASSPLHPTNTQTAALFTPSCTGLEVPVYMSKGTKRTKYTPCGDLL